MTLTAQFQVQPGIALRRRTHGPNRFTGQNPLPDAAVNSPQTGQEGMISLAMFDDQYKPIASEGACEKDAPVIWRNYGSAGAGLVDQPLGRLALFVGLAEAERKASGDRGRHQAAGLAKRPCKLSRRG